MSVWIFAGWILFRSVWSSRTDIGGSLKEFSPNLLRVAHSSTRNLVLTSAARFTLREYIKSTGKHLTRGQKIAFVLTLQPYMFYVLPSTRAEELFLRGTYMGRGSDGGYVEGFETASNYFLQQSVSTLSLADSYLLIAVASAPDEVSEIKSKSVMLGRRNQLLQDAARASKITPDELVAETARPLFAPKPTH